MKLRKSVINKYSVEALKEMGKRGERKIVNSYSTNTRGHQMEDKVDYYIDGDRNIELALKDIIIEADGYCKYTKTLTEVKSNCGSKVYAMERCLDTVLLIYALQDLQNCRKIKNAKLIGVNNKITRKYGMDFSVERYSYDDFKNKVIFKVRGFVTNQKQMNTEIAIAYERANDLITKMNLVNA